jgi:hypothetical protein
MARLSSSQEGRQRISATRSDRQGTCAQHLSTGAASDQQIDGLREQLVVARRGYCCGRLLNGKSSVIACAFARKSGGSLAPRPRRCKSASPYFESTASGSEKMEDLRQYLTDFVEPAIADFERNPASVRHAFMACVVTFHAVDYLAHPRRPAPLRQEWNRLSRAFAIVDDVAHAFKHMKAGNPANPDLRAKQVVAMPGGFHAAAFDGRAFDVGSVTLENEPDVNVLAVVQEAAAFIRAQLDPP